MLSKDLDKAWWHSIPLYLLGLTTGLASRINVRAAVAATRGDLGQLAPRKKLLKSCRVSQKTF
jgi:hypothetical protein